MSKVNEELSKEIDSFVDFEQLSKDLTSNRSVYAKFVAELVSRQLEKNDYDIILYVLNKMEEKIPSDKIEQYHIAIKALVDIIKLSKK